MPTLGKSAMQPNSEGNPMLELKHVGFETDDNKEILRDINLTVQDRFVAITGPNGGGKSTLAKVIAGIYQPTSGQILLDGQDITRLSITERANLGMSRSEEHTSELQSRFDLVCRLLLEKKNRPH